MNDTISPANIIGLHALSPTKVPRTLQQKCGEQVGLTEVKN